MAAPEHLVRVATVLLLLAASVFGPVAFAQSHEHARVVLAYRAEDPSCPSRDAFVDAVASRLGYDPFVTDAQQSVRVEVIKRNGYTGTLTMGGARTLRSRSCAELVDSLAVAVALGVDPDSAFRAPGAGSAPSASPSAPVAPSSPPSAPPPPPPPPLPPPPAEPAKSESHPLRLSLGPMGTLGDTPAATMGVAVVGELTLRRHLGVEAELHATLPSAVRIGSGGRGEASVALFGTTVGLCALLAPASFCATATGGAAAVGVDEVDVARPTTALHTALGLRASLRLHASKRFFLRAQLDGQAPLTRLDLRIDGVSLWTTFPITARAGLLAGVLFP